MKVFLAVWVIFQLFVIELTGWTLSYQMNSDTYICDKEINWSNIEYIIVWILIPLVFFTSIDEEIRAYCSTK